MSTQIKGFHGPKGVGAVFTGISLVDGRRTPFGKMSGGLSSVSPTDLGILASRAALQAANVPGSSVDQAIAANIGQSSADTFFSARHIGLYSGLPLEAPALLVQRICGSGIETLGLAAEQIAIGKARCVLACGTETMSRFPVVSFSVRQGFTIGKPEFIDLLWEALNDSAAVPMGHTADNLARKYSLTRKEVDEFALASQMKCAAARERGYFAGEIAAVAGSGVLEASGLKPRKYRAANPAGVSADEHPRKTSLEKLAALAPVFTNEGPTTAGTASGIVDGACAAVVASEDFVKANGLKEMGRILGVASVGVPPDIMGIGPTPAIRVLLSELGMTLKNVDLFEINEAFGAQCLAVARDLDLDLAKLNVNGGAIAIGHPLAATGVRLAVTCLRALREKGKHMGIVSACIGGGQGIAMALEAK